MREIGFTALVRRKNAFAGHFDGAIRRGRRKRIGIGPVPARKTRERAVRLSFHWKIAIFRFKGKRFFRLSSQKNAFAGHLDGAIRRGRKKRIGIGPVPARKTQERAVSLSYSLANSDFSF